MQVLTAGVEVGSEAVRSAWGQPIQPRDPAQVEHTAHGILSQAQFRPPSQTLIQRLWHWINSVLSSVLGHVSVGRFNLPPWVVVTILLAVLAIAAVTIGRRGGFRLGRGRSPKTSPAVIFSADELGIAAAEWLGRAEAAESRGDWREGVRCRYRSIVAVLAAAGAIQEEIGRTAGEYRAEVEAGVPGAGEPFGVATTVFEETWYGKARAGPEQRDRLLVTAGPVAESARRYRDQNTRDRDAGEPVGTPAMSP